jgi:hypothetical protein
MTAPIRYFYRTEVEEGVERVFTIAYTHDIKTGETKYGGTVFRRSIGDNEIFRKAPHRQTAAERLKIRPVSLIINAGNYPDVETRIRQAVREFGVSGKRNK